MVKARIHNNPWVHLVNRTQISSLPHAMKHAESFFENILMLRLQM
jgi:hypothetical protein